MTEPVVCHEGRCEYKKKMRAIEEGTDTNLEDDLMRQIENELLKENLAM